VKPISTARASQSRAAFRVEQPFLLIRNVAYSQGGRAAQVERIQRSDERVLQLVAQQPLGLELSLGGEPFGPRCRQEHGRQAETKSLFGRSCQTRLRIRIENLPREAPIAG